MTHRLTLPVLVTLMAAFGVMSLVGDAAEVRADEAFPASFIGVGQARVLSAGASDDGEKGVRWRGLHICSNDRLIRPRPRLARVPSL